MTPTEAKPSRDSEQFATEVRGMFDRIAGVYDPINSAMSAGLHHRWRARAVDAAEVGPGDAALDVCCGTGDLTFELARRIGPTGHVIGSDFSERMLDLARGKDAGPNAAPARFEWADALELAHDDATFDAVTVGFGVRNLADLSRGVAEMTRVLKPGGRLVILEITQPTRPPLSTFFSIWFDRIVPVLGTLAGDSAAYNYLPESVKRFPPPEGLAEIMDGAGLEGIRWTILAGGIIAVHSARRPGASPAPSAADPGT